MPKFKQPKVYVIRGISFLAHDKDEAFEMYKQRYIVDSGEIVRVGRSFFRVIGGKLHEILGSK